MISKQELPISSRRDEFHSSPENPPCSSCNPFCQGGSPQPCMHMGACIWGADSHADVFIISPKNRKPEALQQWRRATLVLNAARRFRYVEDLECHRRLQRFHTSVHVLVATRRFESFVTPHTDVSLRSLPICFSSVIFIRYKPLVGLTALQVS
ncbi:hypothetical protein L7F22_004148 [Adiantum nelumboides]|nr:hypothetical protein [Adiantum nelumboides]